MSTWTQQSVAGFVASDPQLSHTERGDARLYMKVGVEHYRREADNSLTKLETTFHDLVAFKAAAEFGYLKLAKGDRFIATGRVQEHSYERDGVRHRAEQFVATRLGHDLARTRYTIDRAPRRQLVNQMATRQNAAVPAAPAQMGRTVTNPRIGM